MHIQPTQVHLTWKWERMNDVLRWDKIVCVGWMYLRSLDEHDHDDNNYCYYIMKINVIMMWMWAIGSTNSPLVLVARSTIYHCGRWAQFVLWVSFSLLALVWVVVFIYLFIYGLFVCFFGQLSFCKELVMLDISWACDGCFPLFFFWDVWMFLVMCFMNACS